MTVGGLLKKIDGPGKRNTPHLNQWNPSIFNQTNLKRTLLVMTLRVGEILELCRAADQPCLDALRRAIEDRREAP